MTTTPPNQGTPASPADGLAGRLDHMDDMLHKILAIVEPVGAFLDANKDMIERGRKLLDPLGLRGRKAGRNGG